MLIDLYEETGLVSGGRGANGAQATNVGWKNLDTLDGTPGYVYYPIRRTTTYPEASSFTKVNYFKIYSTYAGATRVKVRIEVPAGMVGQTYTETGHFKIAAFVTSVYVQPTKTMLTQNLISPGGAWEVIVPLSLSGPNTATTYYKYLTANTTYYTPYIITQCVVFPESDWASDPLPKYGNLPAVKIKCVVEEYESGVV